MILPDGTKLTELQAQFAYYEVADLRSWNAFKARVDQIDRSHLRRGAGRRWFQQCVVRINGRIAMATELDGGRYLLVDITDTPRLTTLQRILMRLFGRKSF